MIVDSGLLFGPLCILTVVFIVRVRTRISENLIAAELIQTRFFLRVEKLCLVKSGDIIIARCICLHIALTHVDSQLFKSMQNSQHCINCLLPDTRNTAYFTRRRNNTYELPFYRYSWSRCSFANRSLYNFIWSMVLFYITSNWYIINVLTIYSHVSHMYIYIVLCVRNKDQSIN